MEARNANASKAAGAAAPLALSSTRGLLQRKCACGTSSHGNEECAKCAQEHGALQRKLTVGSVDDPLEREADRTAAAVVGGGHAGAVQAAPPQISRASTSNAGVDVPQSVHRVIGTSGEPIDAATRGFMESGFGRDFSGVRVHAGPDAHASASDVDAAAYTVGRHVVFGAGHYAPGTQAGRQLLAHELTHVLQQTAPSMPKSGDAAVLRRQPKKGSTPPGPRLDRVVVDQTSKQSVVATFSDGTTLTDECSTGKGHCCFDPRAGTAEGGVCSASRSNQTDNNCTPVGTFKVTKKIPKTHGGIEFWTQFHDAKMVALHNYDAPPKARWPLVTGEPLSHGCVRLHRATAEKIFNGAVEGKTEVVVKNLARPSCSDANLQHEWANDFNEAGSTPPDGTMINFDTGKNYTPKEIASEKFHIEETRGEMRSALGVNDKGLDTELGAYKKDVTARSASKTPDNDAVAPRIPRCVPAKTQEETRIPDAQKAGFLGADAAATDAKFAKALKGATSPATARRVVTKFGEDLWKQANAAARKGGSGTDDRQIYWTRLMLESTLRNWDPAWRSLDADGLRRLHAELLQTFEQTSRGFTAAKFTGAAGVKRILISGFDPFGFAQGGDIKQSNASGAAALALNGETLTDGKSTAEVQSVVYPVRFADFDAGIVESFLGPQLSGANPPNLVMSISQGSNQFELEEYAGRRRSTNAPDNLNAGGGGTQTAPVVAPGIGPGDEFIKTSVPDATLKSMRGALGRKGGAAIPEETEIFDLPARSKTARRLPQGLPTAKTPAKPPLGVAVEGSGGGYLSNEIFYRNSLLRTSKGLSVPMIHLHTPTLSPGASDKARNDLIDTIRKLLRAALPGI